jgi:hypothetical protein
MAGPLTREPTYVGNWECAACFEWYTSPQEFPWQTSEHDRFCSPCVIVQFDRALEFDFNWPASWSNQELNAEDFTSILTPEKIAQLQWKKTAIEALNASTVNGDVEGLVHGKEVQNQTWAQYIVSTFLRVH